LATWLEVAALIVLMFYTRYAGQQSKTMSDTLAEIRKQTGSAQTAAEAAKSAAETASDGLKITQRAYLAIKNPHVSANGQQISIPVENYGHTSAKNLSGSLTYVVFTGIDPGSVRKKEVAFSDPRATIRPGDASHYTLHATIPAFQTGTNVTILVSIAYESGFGKDTSASCLSRDPTGVWSTELCGVGGPAKIDLTNPSKTNKK
jgi:hypothetical protein